jgi:hypothetical protein
MLHVNNDSSKYGAAFLAKNSPMTARALVVDLVQKNPNTSKEDLFAEFQAAIDGDEEHRRAIDWYFFVNMYTYAQPQKPAPAPAARARDLSERRATIEKGVKQTVNQISLLFLTMPNGKAMRYCTGREMETFGKGYAKIAKRAGAKMVGELLSEDEVRSLMAK